MNRDIKGSKAIFLFPLTNHKYLNVYGQCRFRKKKSPTFCNKTVFCFFCLWVTGKEKCLCPSPWLCPDKSIACLHSVSLPALEGRKYFVRQKQLDKLSVCIVNFTWFLIDLVRGFIKCPRLLHTKEEKQRQNNAGGKQKTSSYFILWSGGVRWCPCVEWPFHHVCFMYQYKWKEYINTNYVQKSFMHRK